MKRFKNFVKELTLTQQLVTIILVSIGLFAAFLLFYLDNSVDIFVQNQMFERISSTQNMMIYNYELGTEPSILNLARDNMIEHAIYDRKVSRLITDERFSDNNEELLNRIMANAMMQPEQTRNYVFHADDTEYLYTITKISEDSLLISVISNLYREEFQNALMNQVIYIMIIATGMIFLLMSSWVAYLINSLGQLTAYTEKVKKGEDAELEIDRKDEIGTLATSLVEMNEELQRQQRIKEELVQNISHDLKTPIATIKSYAESIKDGIYPYDSLEKSVDVIIEHSERLENKVQNLLLLNRVGYLVTNENTQNSNLKEVIDKTLLSIKVIRPEVEIIANLQDAVYYGDEEPWRVVIENLLDNALRYAKSKIIITLNEKSLSVENDGPFLSNDRIEKLFKPYEKGTDGKFGLGLSIVYKVVTAYECEIYAYNSHDGVVFKITKKYENERPDAEKKPVRKSAKKNTKMKGNKK